ncbi:hypothetical protein M422DRAFT_257606 [Sphaerobolus stellatus SS14]|uniref:Uncharacterized protein n=1 Tax=Sphaerobolus stellatus (strain SS14) TaxID=990650 RepID=A0A0C9VND2_SPHS4|nr:hypothetical protein M422DRAFT_257606 [Sphaerobolus stellatus SS14]
MSDLIPTRWLKAILSRLLGAKETTSLKTASFLKFVVVRSSNSSHHTAKSASASTSPTPLHPAAKCTHCFRARDHLHPSASSFSIFDRKDKDADPEKKEDIPYEVSLALAVVVKKLVGNMIIKKPLPTACGTPSPPSPRWRSPLSSSPPIFKPSGVWFFSVIQSKLKEVLYPSSSPTWTTSSSSIHLYTARSCIFTDVFACPTTVTATITTTVIKDEASVKVDKSLDLPGPFGGTLNDAEMNAVEKWHYWHPFKAGKNICRGSFSVVFEGNQLLDGAPVVIQLEHIVLSLELPGSPKCTASPKSLHNVLVINLFNMCDNKYIR